MDRTGIPIGEKDPIGDGAEGISVLVITVVVGAMVAIGLGLGAAMLFSG